MFLVSFLFTFFGPIFWWSKFCCRFLFDFRRPSKTLKKPMKINIFWLEGVLLSSFYMIFESMYCRFRIGLEKAEKRAWNGHIKKHWENWNLYFCMAPGWPFLEKNVFYRGSKSTLASSRLPLNFLQKPEPNQSFGFWSAFHIKVYLKIFLRNLKKPFGFSCFWWKWL